MKLIKLLSIFAIATSILFYACGGNSNASNTADMEGNSTYAKGSPEQAVLDVFEKARKKNIRTFYDALSLNAKNDPKQGPMIEASVDLYAKLPLQLLVGMKEAAKFIKVKVVEAENKPQISNIKLACFSPDISFWDKAVLGQEMEDQKIENQEGLFRFMIQKIQKHIDRNDMAYTKDTIDVRLVLEDTGWKIDKGGDIILQKSLVKMF